MSYVIRYQFDPGSGMCLWAVSREAILAFGPSVDHWLLPLTENTKRFLQHLIAWFDTSIDWSAPGDSDDWWTPDEITRFKGAAARGFGLLNDELSANGYVFIDATGNE